MITREREGEKRERKRERERERGVRKKAKTLFCVNKAKNIPMTLFRPIIGAAV